MEKVANLEKDLGMCLNREEQVHDDMSTLEVNVTKEAQ